MHNPKLAEQFHQAMLGIYEAAIKLEPPYRPNDFRRLVLQHGGKAAADKLLDTPDASTGFTELLLRGKEAMKLSVEYLVLSDPWNQLFSEEQIAVATERLREVGCDLPGNTTAIKIDGDADGLHQARPQTTFPPAVRILPMSADLEFPATSIKQLQDDFFLRTLPFTHPAGAYYFRSSGLDSPTETVVLLQFENHLVASATLISSNRFPSPFGRVFRGFDFRASIDQSIRPDRYTKNEDNLAKLSSF